MLLLYLTHPPHLSSHPPTHPPTHPSTHPQALLTYFLIILLGFATYVVWYSLSELKVAIHNCLDTRLHSAFIDDSEHDHDHLLVTGEAFNSTL